MQDASKSAPVIEFARKRQNSHAFKVVECNEVFILLKVRAFDPEDDYTVSVDERMLAKVNGWELVQQFPYLTFHQAEKLAKFVAEQVPINLHGLYGIIS